MFKMFFTRKGIMKNVFSMRKVKMDKYIFSFYEKKHFLQKKENRTDKSLEDKSK